MKYFRFYSHIHGAPTAISHLGLTCFYNSSGVKYGTTTADNCVYSQSHVYSTETMEQLFNGKIQCVSASNSDSPDGLWWGQIEFPTSIDVAYITYDQYYYGSYTYYYDIEIYSSDDGITWTPFVAFINEYGDRSSHHIMNKAILLRNVYQATYLSQQKTNFSFGPVKADDIVLLAIMHYDEVKVLPGWHFMSRSAGLSVRDTYKNQYISLFYKRMTTNADNIVVSVEQPQMDALEISAIVLNGDLVSECEVLQEDVDSFRLLSTTQTSFGFSKLYPNNHYIYLCQSRVVADPSNTSPVFRQTSPVLGGGSTKYNQYPCNYMCTLTDVCPNTKDINMAFSQSINFSGIPVCITRKSGNENNYRFLVSRNDTLYKISGGSLVQATSSTPASALFQSEGFYPASLCKSLIQPTDSLLCWSAVGATPIKPKLNASGTPSAHCITTDNKYFSDNAITGIDTVQINGSPDLMVAMSVDDGATWKYYNGTVWAASTEEDSAMSTKAVIEGLTSVEWAALIGSNRTFKFKVKLKTADSYIENIKVSYKK